MSKFITKSLHKLFCRCPRLFALTQKRPDLKTPGDDTMARYLSKQGDRVARILQDQLIRDGAIEIPPYPARQALKLTRSALGRGLGVVEGSFAAEDAFVRVDGYLTANGGELIEIKSSTKIKDDHVDDVAFQVGVLRNSGIAVERATLAHINPGFVLKPAKSNFKNFITRIDMTAQADTRLATIPKDLADIAKIAAARGLPRRHIGPHCYAPYPCPFAAQCLGDTARDSVLNLRRAGEIKYELHQHGIRKLSEIPAHIKLTPFQQIQAKAEAQGAPIINEEKLRAFLKTVKYPYWFLDFESSVEAIPRHVGTKPYSQVPFQASIHLQRKAGSKLEHFEFLHDQSSDPRPALACFLAKTIGSTGSIIAYHASYERGRIQEMIALGGRATSALESIANRIVDLEVPFDRGWYVDSAFKGSTSIKNILPLLVPDLSYDSLPIRDGATAYLQYLEMISAKTSKQKRAAIRKALLSYCELDTLAMVKILSFLMEVVI
ncbi:DUF2779 domain-containing protein [Bdellovibrionota bacterium FG-2]